MAKKKEMICTHCGYSGKTDLKVKGSFMIELLLWCCFIIPGLIYSIWRVSNKIVVCPKCKGETMIPIDSPMGQKLLGELSN